MSISEMAKRIYETELKAELQRDHRGSYVAIEPSSRDYYVGETFLAAALAAKQAHPDRTAVRAENRLRRSVSRLLVTPSASFLAYGNHSFVMPKGT